MGRNFVPITDSISLGDITTARFLAGSTWSCLAFFRSETYDADDNCVVAKWGTSNGTHGQYLTRVTRKTIAGDTTFEFYLANTNVITTADLIDENVWYLMATTNTGGASNNLRLMIFNMAGTKLHDSSATKTTNVSTLTEPITIGNRAGPNDEMDGDIAHVSYFTTTFSEGQVRQYLINPAKLVAARRSNCLFYLPLGLASPDTDLSGNGKTGTLTGTTVGANPPTGPLFGGSNQAPALVTSSADEPTLFLLT